MHLLAKYRYLTVFFITVILFVLAFVLSDSLSDRKISELREIQEKISLDILSTETRYALLGASSCDHVIANSTFEQGLNEELNDLARRVKFMENELGITNENVLQIKKQYNLLQIKDYLLRKELHDRCGDEIVSVLYFHDLECKECRRQSIVLDELAVLYPEIRIYWLDKDLRTPAMDTLVSMFDVKETPALIVNDEVYEGFQSLSEVESAFPELKKLREEKEKALLKDQATTEDDDAENKTEPDAN